MAQNINLKLQGLWTHPNPHSEVPQGALEQARNITFDRESIASTRRGNRADLTPINTVDKVQSATVYQDEVIYRDETDKLFHKILDGIITQYTSTIAPPVGVRMRYKESNRKLFMTSDNGVQQLVGVGAADYTPSGMPRGLDMDFTLGAGTVIPNDTAVAYRVVWGTKDAFDFLVLGSPSERLIVINTLGSDQDATVSITIPDQITTADFYQVYRSSPSASATTIPNDELLLVFEANPTAGEITAGTLSFTDIVPDDLRRATIYTAPSQQGIAEANENPPQCEDMELFKNHMFFSNTRLRHSTTITLLGVGAPNALQDGDTLTADGVVYTYKVAPAVSTDIKLYTAGTPSQDIDDTARETVKVINAYSGSGLDAYYISGFNDLPGIFQLRSKDFDPSGFSVQSSRDTFDPPAVFNGGEASNDDDKVNRIYFSKNQQPEAVPLGNFFDIGSAEEPIQRILSLRETLFVLKKDGVFRIVGSDADTFRVILADSTTTLVASETAVVHNNQLMMFSDQGVVSLDENGAVAILSRPIEQQLLELTKEAGFDNSFAVSYESDRKYILWTLSDSGNIDVAYTYNSITETWATWVYRDIHETDAISFYHRIEVNVQLVNPDTDELISFVDDIGDYELWHERKSYTLLDHHDGEVSVTVDNQPDSTSLELDTQYAGQDGFIDATFAQGIKLARITSVSTGTTGTILHFDVAIIWSLIDPSTILVPIDVILQWTPISVQNAGMIKWFRDFSFIFEQASFGSMNLTFKTDFGGGNSNQSIVPDVSGFGWGNTPFGNTIWGGQISEIGRQVIRILPPRDAVRGHWMEVTMSSKQANQSFSLAGISLMYDNASSKFKGIG